jgi:hypothetical protein
MKHRSAQSGVALVITLIMLSVITLIAVAFLALSQRERSSISSTMSATEAELMAAAGSDRAKADILAQMYSFIATNLDQAGQLTRRAIGPDLSVSLVGPYNYANLTNMGPPDYQVLTNLLYDPPAPIFATNWGSGRLEHVAYVDLNRNGRFDRTGYLDILDSNGNPTGQKNFVIGDPQWIGVTARPNEPHSSSNRFIGRYAYLIVPIGRTHDIDFAHNDALQRRNAGFARNQGHGTWEMNLAAFLADLNTNTTANYGWGDYRSDFTGIAFDDAFYILNYRYRGLPARTASDFFGTAANLFATDGIDQYGDGETTAGLDNDDPGQPWPGASNPQHFFTLHDFFNPKAPNMGPFQNRLKNANNQLDSYNAHTFYRMLAQIGRDTAPEKMRYDARVDQQSGRITDDGPININYVNNTNGLDATDFVNWEPTNFFHVAADRLLRDHGLALSSKDIQLYPRNDYTPLVHRILQLAANIYDATSTNRGDPGLTEYPFYPTALKPIFDNGGGNVVRIVGYREIKAGDLSITNAARWFDLSNATERAALPADGFVYGVPIVIGAKRGYPNFNEFVFQMEMQVERKLEVVRPIGGLPNGTNHMFMVGVSNFLGMEIWNSYTNAFPRGLRMIAGAEVTRSLYNDEGFRRSEVLSTNAEWVVNPGGWGPLEFRYGLAVPPPNKGWVNDIFQPYSIYYSRTMISPSPPRWEPTFPARPPQWVLGITNRLRFFLFDNGHLVDAVGLAPAGLTTNITKALVANPTFGPLWKTNLFRGIPEGIWNQIQVSRPGGVPGWDPNWVNFAKYDTTGGGKTGFEKFLTETNNARTNMGVPYTPYVKIYRKYEWRANDPLVHYIDADLRRDSPTNVVQFAGLSPTDLQELNRYGLGKLNPEYKPWRLTPGADASDIVVNANPFNTDPGVAGSDAWEFPTNKLASLGWLGRVHRGTPWQTIYFKPAAAHLPVDPQFNNWGQVHYSMRMHPTNDWRLADIFTVAQHQNATRGRVSVNQTNVAAWSGVLSGIRLPMESGGMIVTNVVEPAFIDPRLDQLVTAINTRREQLPGQVFSSMAEFVSVPELSLTSPYLTSSGTTFAPQATPRDWDYEALLEKTLSLVKVGEPRFEIYTFGQSLKPAAQSILTDSKFPRLCINYEVTGELAARAVMRVDLVPTGLPAGQPQRRPQAVIESYNILPPD